MCIPTYSLAAKCITPCERKEVFAGTEPKVFSPFIEKCREDILCFLGYSIKDFPYSKREVKLCNGQKLDILLYNKEDYKKSTKAIIIENQYGANDTGHLNKISTYIDGLLIDSPKIKDIVYIWIAENHDNEFSKIYNHYINKANTNCHSIFYRVSYYLTKEDNKSYIHFSCEEDSLNRTLRLPYDYDNENKRLKSEAEFGLSDDIKYPALFETFPERVMYKESKEIFNNEYPSEIQFVDGSKYEDTMKLSIININQKEGNSKFRMNKEQTLDTIQGIKYQIINPPYKGTLHLEFLKPMCIALKKSNGQGVIIEPANALYTNRKMQVDNNVLTDIFPLMDKHVVKVKICNVNDQFEVGLRVPFAITYLDYSKEYDIIEFDLFGELKIVSSLDDINLKGSYKVIEYINKQIQNIISLKGSAADHYVVGRKAPYEKIHKAGNWYLRNMGDVKTQHGANSDTDYVLDTVHNVQYYGYMTTSYVHKNCSEITDHIDIQYKNGKELSHPNGYTYCDNKTKLENFKKFILTNNIAHYITSTNCGSWKWERELMPFWDEDDCSEEALYKYFDKSDPKMFAAAKNLIEEVCEKWKRGTDFLNKLEG